MILNIKTNNTMLNSNTHTEIIDIKRLSLHKFSAIAALFIVILLIGEIIVYSIYPRLQTTQEVFELFRSNWLAGFLTFDLLGIISYFLFIPFILSIFFILRHTNENLMIIGTIIFFIGIAVFFATNTSFSMLSLSNQYALAETEEEKTIILAAGQTMITLFNVNAFLVSYVIVSASWLIISIVMFKSNIFGWVTSFSGIFAGLSGIIAEIIENTIKSLLPVAISLYFAAILLLIIWVAFTGWRLHQIVNEVYKQTSI